MSWLLAATWKGSLLLAIALGIHTLLRDRVPARWRYALLLVVMLRLLMPVAPAAPFSVFNLAPANEPAAVRMAPLRAPVRIGAAIVRPVSPPAQQKRSPVGAIILGLWSAGALLVIARVLRHSTRLARRLRDDASARPLPPELLELLENCREVIGVRRQVRVIKSNIVDTPSLHGLVKPTMLVPASIVDSFTTEQLRFIFLHELAHLRRRDVFLNWITTVIHALQWFNPLVWIAVARLNEDRELACDALALAALDRRERGAYGETVLQILDRFRVPSLVPGLLGMSATKRQMKRRIQMIATFRNESRRAGWLGAVVAVLALVTLTDASAGDRKVFRRHAVPLTPEAKAVMDRLDQNLDLELTAKSIDDVLNAVSNRTGVRLSIAPDAVDQATRQAEITLKAKDLPAHIVLMETLASFGLGLDFNADGATVVKMPERVHPAGIPAGGEVQEERVIFINGDEHAKGAGTRFEIDDDDALPKMGDRMFIKKIDVNNVVEQGKDGVIRRKLQLRGGDEGQPGGSLEIEVRRAPASSAQ